MRGVRDNASILKLYHKLSSHTDRSCLTVRTDIMIFEQKAELYRFRIDLKSALQTGESGLRQTVAQLRGSDD